MLPKFYKQAFFQALFYNWKTILFIIIIIIIIIIAVVVSFIHQKN